MTTQPHHKILLLLFISTFLLPAVITAEHVARAKINHHPSWIDFGEGVALGDTTVMKPMDAVIPGTYMTLDAEGGGSRE